MSVGWIRHAYVGSPGAYSVFTVVLWTRWFGFGIEVNTWGVRLLLGLWHLCIHVPWEHL